MSTAAQRASWFPSRVVALCRALRLPEEHEKGALYVETDTQPAGDRYQLRQRIGPGVYEELTAWLTEREMSACLDGMAIVAVPRVRRPSRIRTPKL